MNNDDYETIKEDNEKEKITIDQMSDIIGEAKKIMLLFIEDYFGQDNLNRVHDIMNDLEIYIDRDPKNAKLCSAYYEPYEGIFLTEKFCEEQKNTILMTYTIIHECAHYISYVLTNDEINAVVEEGFANLFAEMSINNYIQKGNEINYINEEDKKLLSENNGYYKQDSYIDEGDFTRSIIYALNDKNLDIEALDEYFFGEKEEFVNICEDVLGYDLRKILTEDLANVTNGLGEDNNTYLYLPQAATELIRILKDHFNYPLDEDTIKQKKGEIYTVDVPLINVVCYENKLRYECLKNIDFSKVDENNMQQIFSKISVKDIQELCKKTHGYIKKGCLKWGYSDFIKLLIRGWYSVNKENVSDFLEITSLTGGIPFDIFKEIVEDKGISDSNDVVQLILQYQIFKDENNHSSILEILNKRCGNQFSKEQYEKQRIDYENQKEETKQEENKDYIKVESYLIEVLLNQNFTNEDMQKILYIYNNSFYKITLENIWDVLDVLEKIDYSAMPEEKRKNFILIGIDTAILINEKKQIDDIEILTKISKLPNEIRGFIEGILDIDKESICNNITTAISVLDKSGYTIENEDEINDNIMKSDYKNIKIVPELNSRTLEAFKQEKDKTKILLNTCINQFLENEATDFFNIDENYYICLMLLDPVDQEALGMSDIMIKRVCSIIQEKLNNTTEFENDTRKILERDIRDNLRKLEEKGKKDELGKDSSDSSEFIGEAVEATKETTTISEIDRCMQITGNQINKNTELGNDKI